MPFLQNLKKVEILHNSGKSAANFINKIYNNPNEWWNRKDVQKIRNDFIKNYSNFSANWIQLWEKEFKEQLKKN